MNTKRLTPDHFINSEIEEASIARRLLNNEPVNAPKLWHCPGRPTVYNAIAILAPQFGIVPVSETIRETGVDNGRAYVATVKAQCGTCTRFGAGISKDSDIALLLAYRNAVTMLISADE